MIFLCNNKSSNFLLFSFQLTSEESMFKNSWSKLHPSSFPMVLTYFLFCALFPFLHITIFPREHYWFKFHILLQFIFSSYFYILLHIHICKNKNFKSAFPSKPGQTNGFISRSAEHPTLQLKSAEDVRCFTVLKTTSFIYWHLKDLRDSVNFLVFCFVLFF